MTSTAGGAPSFSAADFLSSVGINTHVATGKNAYGDIALVKSSLDFLGVDTVRDVFTSSQALVAKYQVLADAGVKFDFLLPSLTRYGSETALTQRLMQIDAFNDANPGSVVAVEGPNEVDNWTVTYDGQRGVDAALAIQEDLYAYIKGDLSMSGVDVYGFTLGSAGENGAAQTGELLPISDAVNLHLYTSTDATPGASIDRVLDQLKADGVDRDVVITETGFTTVSTRAYMGVDEATQAKYTLMAVLDSFAAGVDKTYLYELFDSAADASGTDPELHFGLFRADGTPKLAAIALHNMMAILADDGGEAAAPGVFGFALGQAGCEVEAMTLGKGDGSTALVLWPDVRSWNGAANSSITTTGHSVTVYFNERYDSVSVYDPLTGETAIYRANGADRIVLNVVDHPLIIEVGKGFAPSDGVYSGTAAEIAERLPALELASVLKSVEITDGHYLPVASAAAMRELMALAPKALAAIEGGYGFSVTTSDATVVRTSFYDATGALEGVRSEYVSAGEVTLVVETHADGSSESTTYDDGVATAKTVVHADHSREEYLYGVTGESYVTQETTYDAQGRTTGVTYSRADGSPVQVWTKSADGAITDLRYGADGLLVSSFKQGADGATEMTTYVRGVAVIQNSAFPDGSKHTISFDASGAKASESFVHIDGTRETYVYGVKNQSYVTTHTVFDASGKQIETYRLHDDGSYDYVSILGDDGATWTKTFDASGAPVRVTRTLADGSFDSVSYAGGVKVSETVQHADGSRDVYLFNIKNQPYATRQESYDASGRTTDVVYARADGTLQHTWSRAADGTIVDTLYDAAGHVISIYTKTPDGHETYVTVSGDLAQAPTHHLGDGAAGLLGDADPLGSFLTGTKGADRLAGHSASDLLIGGAGDDLYLVDSLGDRVFEFGGGGGGDTVRSTVSYKLGDNVENLLLAGRHDIDGTGNDLANKIVGNKGDNVINGGEGADLLKGGAGHDTFVFDAPLTKANADRILDFDVAEDTIRLASSVFVGLKPGALDAGALHVGSVKTQDADDRIIYDDATGKLYFDQDGSGKAHAAALFATIGAHLALTAEDFFIA